VNGDDRGQGPEGAASHAREREWSASFEALSPEVQASADYLQSVAQGTVPRDEGALAASSFTSFANNGEGTITATVGYDDPKAPYVHEGFHFGRKQKKDGAKWLEKAADSVESSFKSAMRKAARAAVKQIAASVPGSK
jgi:hypothetical protein